MENSSEVNKPFKMASAGVLFNHFWAKFFRGPKVAPKKKRQELQVPGIFNIPPPPPKKNTIYQGWNAARSGVSPNASRLLGSFLVGLWAVGMLTIWTVSRWMCPHKKGEVIFSHIFHKNLPLTKYQATCWGVIFGAYNKKKIVLGSDCCFGGHISNGNQ